MEIKLPENSELDIATLQRIFDDKSECYKLFWLKAIITEVKNSKRKMTYNQLLCHMMADAYYMVNEYHLNLGPKDSLERIVKEIHKSQLFKTSEKIDKLYDALLDYKDKSITSLKSNLINDVPYCLQSKFLENTTISKMPDSKHLLVEAMNRQRRLMYYYSAYSQYATEIELTDAWYKYLDKNQDIVMGWINYKLIEYLQRRNPTIPGIIDKIAPSQERDLKYAKAFWRAIITRNDVLIRDCYTGKILNEESFAENGRMEIDHFIPWTYVASDEIWNLTPTFKKVNGQKSDNLPELGDIAKMAEQHTTALAVADSNSALKKLKKEYLNHNLNSSDLRETMYDKLLDSEEYGSHLEKTIIPIYNSAMNIGYSVWDKKGIIYEGV